MGFYSNRASFDKITAVDRVCHCVITVIQRSNLCAEDVKWLRGDVKEVAKQRVEN